MTRKNQSITLAVSESDMQRLEEIAMQHGCKWGDNPNVSELLRQIAGGELIVISRKTQLNRHEQLQKAIAKAFNALIEIQQILFGENQK